MLFRILFFWVIALLLCTPAIAGEPLIFRDSTRDLREQSIVDHLLSVQALYADDPIKIATFDLNGDGVDEWIVRQDSVGCESNANCSFAIAGLSRKKPVFLGSFAGRKIGIADEKLYGVRKIVVYDNKNNDFASTVYAWNPQKSAYKPE